MTMTSPSSVDLAGRRTLVVEDQFLIAMDIEDMLRTLGANMVDIASSIADALAAIDRTKPDFAILDLKLDTETTAPIAERLQALRIPFVFVTGYDDLSAMPPPLRRAPLIRKPVDMRTLSATLKKLNL
jgi:two-component SAPR family response regulator